MSLSASTLALFIFLVPGLIFRASVYWLSLVRRPFGSNTLYSTVAIILVAVSIHAILALIGYSIESLAPQAGLKIIFPRLVEHEGVLEIKYIGRIVPLTTWLLDNLGWFLGYFLAISLLALLLAWAVRALADRFPPVGRALYGPISDMISSRDTAIITCFVLTKVQHDTRRLVYAGWPQDISLREGNNIDHVVLRDPYKFYLRLNDMVPTTTKKRARPISSAGDGASFMYVAKEQIENVHFEAFYFPDKSSKTP